MLNKLEQFAYGDKYFKEFYFRLDGNWYYQKNFNQLLPCDEERASELEKSYKDSQPKKTRRKSSK